MRSVAGIILAILLVVPSLAFQASASDLPGINSPRVVWSMDFNYSSRNPDSNFTDLNGDGAEEMMIYWGYNYTFFDTRSYNILLSLNDSTIKDVDFARVGNATAMDILVRYQTYYHFNISVISGKNFKETWRSPDMNGTGGRVVIRDIDADGQPEFVIPAYDWNSTFFHVFGAMTHELEWSSQRIVNERPFYIFMISNNWIRNIDEDPALELMTSGDTPNDLGANPINAYDGATHEKQWSLSLPEPFYFIPTCDPLTDFDNDSEPELMLPYVSRGEPSQAICGLNAYSTKNGSLEWNAETQNGYLSFESMADLDGDGWIDVLMESETMNQNGGWNDTYSIFSPKENRSLWTAGPFVKKDNESYRLQSRDLDSDGRPEAIFLKTMIHGDRGSTVIFQIIRGPDFAVKWTSPETWMSGNYLRTYSPSDGSAPRILLTGTYHSETGNISSTLSIVSTADFQVFFNNSFVGDLTIYVGDLNGDMSLELFLASAGYELLDGNGFQRIWNVSWPGSEFFDIDAADFCGGPQYELLRLSHVTENRPKTPGGVRTFDTSTILLYDSQTLEQLWSSQRLDGLYHFNYVDDIDNDTNIEALFRVFQPGDDNESLVMIEFPKDESSSGTPWPPGLNLRPPTVTIDKPRNNQKVSGTVKITGTAEDDTCLAQVMVRIDDGEWANTTWKLGSGNLTCSWNHSWDSSQASKGTHKIYARAFDGAGWSSEVSITVEVRPPGTTTPEWPVPMINSFPDPACIALMAAALVAAVAAFLVHRRRK